MQRTADGGWIDKHNIDVLNDQIEFDFCHAWLWIEKILLSREMYIVWSNEFWLRWSIPLMYMTMAKKQNPKHIYTEYVFIYIYLHAIFWPTRRCPLAPFVCMVCAKLSMCMRIGHNTGRVCCMFYSWLNFGDRILLIFSRLGLSGCGRSPVSV